MGELKANANKVNKKTGSTNGLYWQLPVDDQNTKTSEQEVLSNLSIGMALTLARAFGAQSKFLEIIPIFFFMTHSVDPAVVKAILQTLLDGLVIYKPLSLKLTPGLKSTLDSIQSFAKEMLSVNSDTGTNLL